MNDYSYKIVSPIILLNIFKEMVSSGFSNKTLDFNSIKNVILKNNKFSTNYTKGKNTLLPEIENTINTLPFSKYNDIRYSNQIIIDNVEYPNIKWVVFATGYKRNDIVTRHKTSGDPYIIDFYSYEPNCFGEFSYPLEYYIIPKTITQEIQHKRSNSQFNSEDCLRHYTEELRKCSNIIRLLFNKK